MARKSISGTWLKNLPLWAVLAMSGAGIYVTAMLSVARYLGSALSCGTSDDCAIVAASNFAAPGGVPLAYCGLAYYAIIFGFSATWVYRRRFNGVAAITALSVTGAAISSLLTWISSTQLHAHCLWCITSNILAVGLALTLLLTDRAKWAGQVNAPRWPMTLVCLSLAAAIGFGTANIRNGSMFHSLDMDALAKSTPDELAPADSLSVGKNDGPVSVVVFADLQCPICRKNLPELVRKAQTGSFRLVVRLFPLPAHAGSFESSVALAKATVVGRGLDFLLGACEGNYGDETGLARLSHDLGVDQLGEAETTSAQMMVRRDMAFAKVLGVKRTPTLLALRGHGPAKMVSLDQALHHGGMLAKN